MVNNYKTESPPPSPKVAAPHKRPSNESRPPMKFGDQTTFDDDHENCTNTIIQISGQERPRTISRRDSPRPLEGFEWQKSSVDSKDSTMKDSFVHGLLFVFAFIVFILLKLPLLV